MIECSDKICQREDRDSYIRRNNIIRMYTYVCMCYVNTPRGYGSKSLKWVNAILPSYIFTHTHTHASRGKSFDPSFESSSINHMQYREFLMTRKE